MGGAALPLIAMGAQVIGGVMQGASGAGAAAANKRILNFNADRAMERAADARLRGASTASRKLGEGSQVIGAARAIAGGSGVDVQSGSVVDTLAQTRATAALDAETIKNNALREALGYEAEADNFRFQASQQRSGTAGAILNGVTGAISTGYSTGTFPKFGKG